MDKLTQESIEEKLTSFPEWSLSGDVLQRTFGFDTFQESMTFVGRVAQLAEELGRHPDILIRYNKVTLVLRTQDAGGVTELDFNFAREMDAQVSPA